MREAIAWTRIAVGVAVCVACSSNDDSSAPAKIIGDAGPSGDGGTRNSSGGSAGAAGDGASGSGGSSGGSGGGASDGGANGASGGTSSGGTGTDAGPPVYSTNRAEFFGAPRCPTDLLLCDDFEADALDTATWEPSGNAPVIDAMHAARGTRALHAHTTGNAFSYVRETKTFPAAMNRYWGRLFVYFDALPVAPQWAHWTIVGANGQAGAGEIRVGGQYDGKTNRFGVGTDGGPTGDWTNLDGDPQGAVKAAPEGQWACIEWLHDGSADETRFFWDGVPHPSLDTTSTDHGHGQGIDPAIPYVMPDMSSVWVGWWLYQSGPTPDHFDVWIDSVAIDDERIGCSR